MYWIDTLKFRSTNISPAYFLLFIILDFMNDKIIMKNGNVENQLYYWKVIIRPY